MGQIVAKYNKNKRDLSFEPYVSAPLRLGGAVLFLLLTAHCLLLTTLAQPRDFTRWVNPFIGTGGHGHTFPGATMPFGMVQLSPDTRIDNWDGSSGYHYSDDIIYGFSHTHLSGTGIPDGCDILFMPTVGSSSITGPSKFSHSSELAEPGYYAVKLDQNGVFAELTATTRVGMHRYSFPSTNEANVSLNLEWRDKVIDSEVKTVGNRRIEGFRRSTSWSKDQTVYFVAEFSKPFQSTLVSDGTSVKVGSAKGTKLKAVSRFSTKEGEKILIKIAISYVSIEGARKNLAAELPGWDFDKVRADAKAAWNKELSKIEVSGGTDEQTTNFYTALYHTMIQPNVFNDVDGQYKGHDGKIHQLQRNAPVRNEGRSGPKRSSITRSPRKLKSASPEEPAIADKSVRGPSEQYTVFSLWDTFRAAHPLYTIIDQKRTVDFINTFIRQYEQGGRLPVWELWGEETDTMIGYHAVSVIADAMAKGIKGFDYEKAYAAAKHSAELNHFGLDAYKKRGYISGEDENESVSKTLEYAYDDWCILQMQKVLNSQGDFKETPIVFSEPQYWQRSRYYENLFDPQTGFMRPKRNGGWISPFQPNEVTFHFTEGNSWQYSFFVPQDILGLVDLYGGRKKFAAKLDELFTTEQKLTGREQPDITGLIGQYAHGNEPSHHIPYLYNYADQPWKTQKMVRKILDEFYKNSPDGLIGNEDCGQMSAWYILSSSGFYPVAPGKAVYDLGSPIFKEVKFNLENGKSFVVRSQNNSPKNVHVRSATLNGKPLDASYIRHEDIMRGGILDFEMSDTPNEKAFSKHLENGTERMTPAVPVIEGERVFKGKTTITLKATQANTRITYTADNLGEEFARKTQTYTGPFTIVETTKVEAYVTNLKTGVESMKVEAIFAKRPNDWTVKLNSEFNSQYPGSSYDAIIDGLRGNTNFAAGEWQGYHGRTFEAVIDLQRETEIKSVGGSFLQSARSWIWMPDRLEFEASSGGVNFTKVADFKPGFPQQEMNGVTKEFRQAITPVKARYVRVRAYNFGKIPAWHLGAGGDPWIFVDEIFID